MSDSKVCSPGMPNTQGQAGGSTFPSVQWSGCVRLVSFWVREVNLLPTPTVQTEANHCSTIKFSIDFVYLVYIEMERYANPRATHIRQSGTR